MRFLYLVRGRLKRYFLMSFFFWLGGMLKWGVLCACVCFLREFIS